MNAIGKAIGRMIVGCVFACCLTLKLHAQTPLLFTQTTATSEGAIQLHWQSQSNAIYQVQYISDLTGNSGPWQVLVDDYPSQGTNTLWLDTGDYLQTPPVLHPKYTPYRFYQVVCIATNPVPPPSVSVTFPTAGADLTGQITVSVATASTNLPFITPTLYVDGQAMYSSPDGTNFMINTCEWPNGPHILFATAKGLDNLPTQGDYSVNTAYGASAYVPVTFDNFISQIAFSQQFFEPSLGQTQEVTATFAANAAWTLTIVDQNSNVVQTATGSGPSMTYDWDGTGTGGTNLNNGVYYYLVSAQSNGPLPQITYPAPNGGGSPPPSPSMMSLSAATTSSSSVPTTPSEAMAEGLTSYFVPSPPMPPVRVETNGGWEFIPYEDVYGPTPPTEISILPLLEKETEQQTATTINSSSAAIAQASLAHTDAAGASGSSGQSSTPVPSRPSTAPVRGANGMYGVAYYDFPVLKSHQVPFNGMPSYGIGEPPLQQIQGSTGSFDFTNIAPAPACANRFAARMQGGGWKEGFKYGSTQVALNDLRKAVLGGNEIFGNVTVGLLISHGFYGTAPDYHADLGNGRAMGCYDTYIAGDNPADAGSPWLRLTEFGFDGSLRYMGIFACWMLTDQDNNFSSMNSLGVLPIPSSLHLVCGASTLAILTEDVGEKWADNMCGTRGFIGLGRHAPQTVQSAWFNAGSDSYSQLGSEFFLFPVNFRVAGWSSAMNDTLSSATNSTSGNITFVDQPVH